MKPVLVDTSAWVDFLRPGSGGLGDQVAELIESDCAAICGVIVAELLQGAKGDRELKRLRYLTERIPRMPMLEEDWDNAGMLLQGLRRKGVTIPLTDAVIAVVARRNGLAVLTVDQHFRHLPVTLVEGS